MVHGYNLSSVQRFSDQIMESLYKIIIQLNSIMSIIWFLPYPGRILPEFCRKSRIVVQGTARATHVQI